MGHGLQEAPVVHQLDPDHLGGVIFLDDDDHDDDDDDELHHLLTCVCVASPKVKTQSLTQTGKQTPSSDCRKTCNMAADIAGENLYCLQRL